MTQTFVLVNPASANGKTRRQWPSLALALRSQLGAFEVGFTEYSGHGTVLIREAIHRGVRHVVSVGGDGTHNEVVNGFFEGERCLADDLCLSLVPAGTGGDLRRTLGLPTDPHAAILAVGRNRRRVDLGRMSYLNHDGEVALAHFINIASFGAAGLVDRIVNRSSKVLGGRLSFMLGAVRGTMQYRNQAMQVILNPEMPDEIRLRGRMFNGVIANARFFGGGMKVAPDALMDDGLFDVITMGELSTLDVVRGMPSLYAGTHVDRAKIQTFRASVIRAEPTQGEEILIDLDGEQPGRLPATFSVLPKMIEVSHGDSIP
ncbi:MAG: diacylglycerol kinase family protein [Myxococcota bacterium]|nr:diacylglycerol kinase family protein [Myxococcota bacterium]